MARVAGIPIRLHFTFLLLLAWLFVASATSKQPHPFDGLLFVVGVFVCVLLHELGHALTAMQFFGIRTVDIVLYPIGGLARIERLPEPRQEFWIALAGPAVNAVLALVCVVALKVTGGGIPRIGVVSTPRTLLAGLLFANVVLAGFNLLPAFPMDGGRILRALLAVRIGEVRATVLSARVGQALAWVMGFAGLWTGDFLLIIVAVFVYLAAGQESAAIQTRSLVHGRRVRDAMLTDYRTLPHGARLSEAATALLAGSQQDFPVLNGQEVVGVLPRGALLRGMAAAGADAWVAGAMDRDFARCGPDDSLESVFTQTAAHWPILVMAEEGGSEQLVGMITQENLLEFLALTRLNEHARA
ncbi:MAG: site-2 protease family protein [Armatimonadetes bacterium]|nr:site-2 protease family protein [Armatimonadota bacterium]MDE2205241.1 site-2 protease family protein [Armatimonadota bacterium]